MEKIDKYGSLDHGVVEHEKQATRHQSSTLSSPATASCQQFTMRFSILAGLVVVADAGVIGSKPDFCNNVALKEIVKILKIEKASAFCSQIMTPQTKTATGRH